MIFEAKPEQTQPAIYSCPICGKEGTRISKMEEITEPIVEKDLSSSYVCIRTEEDHYFKKRSKPCNHLG